MWCGPFAACRCAPEQTSDDLVVLKSIHDPGGDKNDANMVACDEQLAGESKDVVVEHQKVDHTSSEQMCGTLRAPTSVGHGETQPPKVAKDCLKLPINNDEPALPAMVGFERLVEEWASILSALPAAPRSNKAKSGAHAHAHAPIDWEVEDTEEFCEEMRRVSRYDLSRFLVAAGGNVKAAMKIAKTAAVWYAAIQPDTVRIQQISAPVAQGCWRFGGWSKCGYPVLLATSKGWAPGAYYSPDEYVRFAAYVMEVMRKTRMGPGVTKFVLVSDMDGFSMQMVRPIAMRCLLHLSFVLQELCSERIAAVLLLNTGAFRFAWPIISKITQPHIRPLMRWIAPQAVSDVMRDIICPSALETRYGGDRQGLWPPFTGNWDEDVVCPEPPAFDPNAPDPSPRQTASQS